jgi:hypothetical protein
MVVLMVVLETVSVPVVAAPAGPAVARGAATTQADTASMHLVKFLREFNIPPALLFRCALRSFRKESGRRNAGATLEEYEGHGRPGLIHLSHISSGSPESLVVAVRMGNEIRLCNEQRA